MKSAQETWLDRETPGDILRSRHMAILALLFPALMLTLFAAGHGTLPGDVYLSRLIQDSFPATLEWLPRTVNAIGGTFGAVILSLAAGAVLIVSGYRFGGMLVLATLVVRPLNEVLKLLAASPRPEPMRVEVIEFAGGLGYPSGHVSGATLFYGALIYLAPRITKSPHLILAVRVTSAIMIVLMGISRVHVGAHWPSDVIGGYLWGAITLLILISLWHEVRRLLERRHPSTSA